MDSEEKQNVLRQRAYGAYGIPLIKPINPDEEIELARKIADLHHFEELAAQFEIEHNRSPTNEEWAVLVNMPMERFRRRLMLARDAKDKMVKSHLYLVFGIAKKYVSRGLSSQDLEEEGCIGLIRAVEKFDHEKGYRFALYAPHWIRNAIQRAIADQ